MVPPHLLPVPLGQIVATPAALGALTQPDIVEALRRHASGDWGEVDAHDQAANDEAMRDGTRLLSAYTSANGTTLLGDHRGRPLRHDRAPAG